MKVTDKRELDLKEIIQTETGHRFNRNNKISCPFHKDNTPSLSFNPKANRWHCFSCGRGGDIIDFIKEYKGFGYIEACNHLGIELNEGYRALEDEKSQVKSYIKWQLNNIGTFKDWKLINIYRFTDKDNKTLYFKAKFSTPSKKEMRYYSFNDGKVEMKRNHEEVPYNLYGIVRALEKNKPIFIVEGEKDADTLIYMGYTATSFKGVKEIDVNTFKDKNIYFIGDTGEAGEGYKNEVWSKLKDHVKSFNIVELTGINKFPDNSDVTDWIQQGYTVDDLKRAIDDSWDWKKSLLWKYGKEVTRHNKQVYAPLKVWQNLKLLLDREGILLKYNLINKEVEASGTFNSIRNDLLTDIYTLNQVKGLNMSREEVSYSIEKIAKENSYNPFIDYLEANRNNNHNIIIEVFNCLNIDDEYKVRKDFYCTLLKKWALNVVRTAHNTLKKGYETQGVLVLQGPQGCFKSTFFKSLMPNNQWFKGGKSLDPTSRDSIKENTKYILVELGEFDSTLKGDQAKLKAFITNDSDEYRSPYARYEEKYPRITTYCATVNRKDFLKDETGTRRYWSIPVESCNIEKLKEINMDEFWGAVYDLWLSDKVKYYLTKEENYLLATNNIDFNVENNISIALDEEFNWDQNPIAWKVYSITEILNILGIKESKALKNEMQRRGLRWGSHRDNYMTTKTKKGYKLPNTDIKEANRIIKDVNSCPFTTENDEFQVQDYKKVIAWNTGR